MRIWWIALAWMALAGSTSTRATTTTTSGRDATRRDPPATASGEVYRIVEPVKFLLPYLIYGDAPPSDSIQPLEGAKVELVWGRGARIRSLTDATGQFSILYGRTSRPPYLRIRDQADGRPVYRSVPITEVPDGRFKRIYILRREVPNGVGVTQELLDEWVREANKINRERELSATIRAKDVYIRVLQNGADIRLWVRLTPYVGPHAGTFVAHKLRRIEVDLPGPDYVWGPIPKAIAKDAARTGLKQVIRGLNDRISEELTAYVVETTGLSRERVENLLSRLAITIAGIKHVPAPNGNRVWRITIGDVGFAMPRAPI